MKDFTARPGPAAIWIELTSKCPLRCVFCSRESLRGEGGHMEFGVLERLLRSLDRVEIVRLNYSGESANYPELIEAIGRTKAITGAHTEMVTSLVSMPMAAVLQLAGSGIDRISISLHSLDRSRFPVLYGGGSLESFERRLEVLMGAARAEARPPAIDFAFVAMASNVAELPAIASLAAASGAPALSVHPVIQREGVPALFQIEAEASGRLTGEFQRDLDSRVARAQEANPGVRIAVARPPGFRDDDGAFTCEQNPFETAHVLSNGDVVACEVMDRIALGNVCEQSLREIWHGAAYSDLRGHYARNEIPECRRCIFRAAVAEVGVVRSGWGWHDCDESGTLWSRPMCSFECDPGGGALVLTGLLPPGSPSNTLEFLRDGKCLAQVRHEGEDSLRFQVELPLDGTSHPNRFTARTEHGFSPWRRGLSGDARELGFALFTADFAAEFIGAGRERGPALGPVESTLKRRAVDLLLRSLTPLESFAGSRLSQTRVPNRAPGDSLAIVIPERDSPCMLAACLAALKSALAQAMIRAETVVVVNGSEPSRYNKLQAAHPTFRFIFVHRPLGFTAAVRVALRQITAGWTYLLNSDVVIDEDALSAVLRHRSAAVFSLASRIRMANESSARETNRTGVEFVHGLANLVELDAGAGGPVDHLYSGGGCSLFQTAWLRTFAGRTLCYDPFYWEDAEWGVIARAMGLRNLFVPESRVTHVGQATVDRYYARAEVSRIFERNRVQFQLRCIPDRGTAAIRERLLHAPSQTVYELLQPWRVASMVRTRAILSRLCNYP